MKKITLENGEYELIKENKNAFNLDELTPLFTDYFYDFDYILGDYAGNKLRLKGFCKKENKRYSKVNDIALLEDYIKQYCAYECKYFILEKKKN